MRIVPHRSARPPAGQGSFTSVSCQTLREGGGQVAASVRGARLSIAERDRRRLVSILYESAVQDSIQQTASHGTLSNTSVSTAGRQNGRSEHVLIRVGRWKSES